MHNDDSNFDDVGIHFNKTLLPTNLKEKFVFATFQIVAEKGADALTASELIKKTNSSKGALFHHFKTLDELCLSSLVYFKNFVKDSIQVGQPESLLDFLFALAQDERKRKSNVAYFHLTHFFRDRAIRDPHFQEVLKEVMDIYSERAKELALVHMKPSVDPIKVRSIVTLYSLSLERIYFHGLLYSDSKSTQTMIQSLIESIHEQLLKL